jgi:hypothetical protein
MSTKDWIVYAEEGAGLFQDVNLGKENNNPATIEIKNPIDFIIESESNAGGKVMSLLKVDIPAERFDELAVAWIKHRRILTRSSQDTLEELLDKCDFKWPITEDELIEGIEDAQLQDLVVERLTQDEIEVNLDEPDMFDADGKISSHAMRAVFDHLFSGSTQNKK